MRRERNKTADCADNADARMGDAFIRDIRVIRGRFFLPLCRLWSLCSTVFQLLLLLPLISLVGCGPHADPRTGRVMPPSKPPPAYPASRDVPLDSQLRAQAEQELLKDLSDNDPNIRAHTIEALREAIGTAHSKEILAALSDRDPLVRYAACLATGELQLRDARTQLLQLTEDPDPGVRVVSRFALHRIGVYTYSHELEILARDPQPAVRGTTAMVLGLIGDPSAVGVLLPLRHDPAPPVRQQAAISLWRLGNEQGLKDLIGWTLSPYQDDQKVALLGLVVPRNRNIVQHVRICLTDPVPEVALVASRAMGTVGCDEGYGVARLGAANTDPRQRVLAALAFGAIGRSDSQDVLRKLLGDADPDVRVAAAEAALKLKDHFVDECSHSGAVAQQTSI
jgi:HEAT repeat protein